jgi:hypothetical protein
MSNLKIKVKVKGTGHPDGYRDGDIIELVVTNVYYPNGWMWGLSNDMFDLVQDGESKESKHNVSLIDLIGAKPSTLELKF